MSEAAFPKSNPMGTDGISKRELLVFMLATAEKLRNGPHIDRATAQQLVVEADNIFHALIPPR